MSLRLVAPFKPFAPESELHRSLPTFDWLRALRMLVASARAAGHEDVWAVTDGATSLPVDAIRVETTETRLMLWTLEACAAYLESDAFDRDTVMLDVDQLIFKPLDRFFPKDADLGVLMRPAYKHVDIGEPLLNGVQFWSVRAKDRLAAFYRSILALARTLPEEDQRWGADTIALRESLRPMRLGLHVRQGLVVSMIPSQCVIEAFSSEQMVALRDRQTLIGPSRPVLDFRWKRKPYMPLVFEHAFGAPPWSS